MNLVSNTKEVIAHKVFYLCILLPVIFVLIIAGGGEKLINYFPDDAFYYLQTAFVYDKTGLISFDGENVTTGFHPLQMLLTVAMTIATNKQNALTFFFLINPIAYIASMSVFLRTVKLKGDQLLIASLVTSFIFTIHIFASSGMESGLVVLFTSILISQMVNFYLNVNFSITNAMALGLVTGLLALSRLDMIIPLAILAIPIGYELIKKKMFGSIVVVFLAFIVVITPYFLWIYHVQGSLFPVSFLAKYSREGVGWHRSLITLSGNSLIGYLILFVCIVLPVLSIIRCTRRFKGPFSVGILSISTSSLLYLFYVVFVAHESYRWYLAYPLIVSVFLVLYSIKELSWQRKYMRGNWLYGFPIVIVILNGFSFYKYYEYQTVSSSLLSMTKSINRIVPQGSKIGTHDAGIVGYFSTSSVHNLDGLANSKYNLSNYLDHADLIGYAKNYKLDYLLLREDHYLALKYSNASYPDFYFAEVANFDVLRMAKVYLLKVNNTTTLQN